MMSAVWVRVRAEVSARWRAWAGLVLLLGLFGGAVIAVSAGARRTDTAYARFLIAKHAWDVSVPDFAFDPAFATPPLDQVQRLPQVSAFVRARLFEAPINQGDGSVASADPRLGTSFNGMKILEGRLPSPDRADEVALPFQLAKVWHLHVGSRVTIPFFKTGVTPEQGAGFGSGANPGVLPVTLRVVGIEAAPGEFPPALSQQPVPFMSTGFYRAYSRRLSTLDTLLVRLKGGARDIPGFTRAVNAMVPRGKVVFLFRQIDQASNVNRSFHLQAIALWLLAGLTGFVSILVFGQTLSRQSFLESFEYPTLHALGMTRRQLTGVAMARATLAAALGAVVAVVVGISLSPLFPTGLARIAEPHPGVAVDPMAVGLGAAAILAIVAALQLFPAWRAARTATLEPEAGEALGRARPSLANAIARAGAPPAAVAGVRLALERGRGRTAVPVRTTILGVTIAIAAFTAAITFGANLDRLLGTPKLYGVNWNLQIGTTSFRSGDADRVLYPALQRDPRVEGVATAGVSIPFEVNGRRVDAIALATGAASVSPPILGGRLAAGPDEIVLGKKTLQALGAHVGGTVNTNITGIRPQPFRVVGIGVIPPVGDVGRLGEGALVRYSSLTRFIADAPPPDQLLVRLDSATNRTSFIAGLRKAYPKILGEIDRPQEPSDLVNFGRVQNMPVILAGLLAALAAGTLAHMLATSIRRRRRDLSILKTIGFSRAQISATVAWQATSLAVVALALGVPLGLAAGRWVWTASANGFGIVPAPVIDLAEVLLAIPATILLANLIAALPARSAARTQPAVVLRSE
jgi:ABC-type lipoprotein release transport system permease subunit